MDGSLAVRYRYRHIKFGFDCQATNIPPNSSYCYETSLPFHSPTSPTIAAIFLECVENALSHFSAKCRHSNIA